MTPSAILLTICISLFFTLAGTFVVYFILKNYKRSAVVAMRVSKRAEARKRELSIQPAAQVGIQPQYPLAKAK
jgi:capsular polysaccharide biosynthesis protein